MNHLFLLNSQMKHENNFQNKKILPFVCVWDETNVGGGGGNGIDGVSDDVFVNDWRKVDGEKFGRKRDDAALVPFEGAAEAAEK